MILKITLTIHINHNIFSFHKLQENVFSKLFIYCLSLYNNQPQILVWMHIYFASCNLFKTLYFFRQSDLFKILKTIPSREARNHIHSPKCFGPHGPIWMQEAF